MIQIVLINDPSAAAADLLCQEWERVEAERRRVKAAEMEERAKLKEMLGYQGQ